MKRSLIAILVLVSGVFTSASAASCTAVLGFSQTRNWFDAGSFPGWELDALAGADLHDWADPAFAGYSRTPCGDVPSRVIYQVAYSPGWAQASDATISSYLSQAIININANWPTASLVLIPIVGGPNHQTCPIGNKIVGASGMHPKMDTAIASSGILAGPDLLVAKCSQYSDAKGHLTATGGIYVASQMEGF